MWARSYYGCSLAFTSLTNKARDAVKSLHRILVYECAMFYIVLVSLSA
jgi:hypothetical protein